MVDVRSWAYFGVGLAGGVAGAWAWLGRASRRGPGKVHEIEGEYYVDNLVVEDLLRRVPGARGSESLVSVPIVRRGRLLLRHDDRSALLGKLYQVHFTSDSAEMTRPVDLLVELLRYGLAHVGGRYDRWTDLGKPPKPLALRESITLPLDGGPRPDGHFFKVGANYYADERFLRTLENFGGAEYDDTKRASVIPIYKRGALLVRQAARQRMLPEQVGDLHMIESQLSGVSLGDFLDELLQYGLVGWGGEWERFPTSLSDATPTGTPPLLPEGHVLTVADDVYVDEPVLALLRTRLPVTSEAGGLTTIPWRGGALRLRPLTVDRLPEQAGRLYHLGPAADERVADFVAELLLRRMAFYTQPRDHWPAREPKSPPQRPAA